MDSDHVCIPVYECCCRWISTAYPHLRDVVLHHLVPMLIPMVPVARVRAIHRIVIAELFRGARPHGHAVNRFKIFRRMWWLNDSIAVVVDWYLFTPTLCHFHNDGTLCCETTITSCSSERIRQMAQGITRLTLVKHSIRTWDRANRGQATYHRPDEPLYSSVSDPRNTICQRRLALMNAVRAHSKTREIILQSTL
jgi:hypothetical protein